MSHVHLTDDQLQPMALNQHTTSNCRHCQAQLSAYQTLYKHVADSEILPLEMDVIILAYLPKYLSVEPKRNYFWIIILPAGLTVIGIGSIAVWRAINWIFNDLNPTILIGTIAFLTGILSIRLLETYYSYLKKSNTCNYRSS